jgi:tetratricopeptide (TPR) repeat protein
MERLQHEAEEEFEFQDEKKRVQPRVFVPQPEIYIKEESLMGPPPFLQEFIVSKQKRQPVQIKLDSIIIKGSKILAFKGKSDYVQGALWLMAKSFFYQEDWLNSQLKCSELVDKYPDGDLSPDAHLLYTKDLLIQRKMNAGEVMLSRTVDIAWQKKRYDILSEAFRIEAELSLMKNDFEKALRPYKNAISQTDDGELKARWQLDMAALMFRMGKFDKSEIAFRQVHNYSPDYVQKFEAYLYQAASLARTGRYKEAEDIFKRLENDGKYEEWMAHTYIQKLQLMRLKWLDSTYTPEEKETIPNLDNLAIMEKSADSAYANNPALLTYYFEKGMNMYKQKDYTRARSLFAKARVTRTPVFKTAEKMFELMNNWDLKRRAAEPVLVKFKAGDALNDSTKLELASNLFTIGRIHEELGNKDSVLYYYDLAVRTSPISKPESSRFYHGLARVVRDKNPLLADSLLDVVVMNHPLTDFGKDAQLQLGYTKNFVIDTVAELYSSGLNLMRIGDNSFSINQFKKLYSNYPKSKYAPAALYTIGWIFEKNLKISDSALYYYKLLVTEYPESEYAKDIGLGVTYKLAVNSGNPIPDSLRTREIIIPPPSDMQKGRLMAPPQVNIKKEMPDARSLLKDPASLLNNPDGLMQNPIEMLKNIELPDNPFSDPVKFFKLDEKSNDSTKKSEKEKFPESPKK